jgi:hypothetical protein
MAINSSPNCRDRARPLSNAENNLAPHERRPSQIRGFATINLEIAGEKKFRGRLLSGLPAEGERPLSHLAEMRRSLLLIGITM